MNGRDGDWQRLLAVLALAAESGQADIEAFIDPIELQDLVVLIAHLADLALKGMTEDIRDPEQRAALCASLRARLAAVTAEDGA
ncbi:hypothetical protein [Streptomyces sp. NPDC058424]|uniref:hypothetical protein n=1 Tax=Streptomyces sp. NPDC058424 TaxID=3346491 RepID=UPI003659A14A